MILEMYFLIIIIDDLYKIILVKIQISHYQLQNYDEINFELEPVMNTINL